MSEGSQALATRGPVNIDVEMLDESIDMHNHDASGEQGNIWLEMESEGSRAGFAGHSNLVRQAQLWVHKNGETIHAQFTWLRGQTCIERDTLQDMLGRVRGQLSEVRRFGSCSVACIPGALVQLSPELNILAELDLDANVSVLTMDEIYLQNMLAVSTRPLARGASPADIDMLDAEPVEDNSGTDVCMSDIEPGEGTLAADVYMPDIEVSEDTMVPDVHMSG